MAEPQFRIIIYPELDCSLQFIRLMSMGSRMIIKLYISMEPTPYIITVINNSDSTEKVKLFDAFINATHKYYGNSENIEISCSYANRQLGYKSPREFTYLEFLQRACVMPYNFNKLTIKCLNSMQFLSEYLVTDRDILHGYKPMEPVSLFTPDDMLPEKDAFELEIEKKFEVSKCTGITYNQLPNIRVQFLFYPVEIERFCELQPKAVFTK
jgi:hypothetical protein